MENKTLAYWKEICINMRVQAEKPKAYPEWNLAYLKCCDKIAEIEADVFNNGRKML